MEISFQMKSKTLGQRVRRRGQLFRLVFAFVFSLFGMVLLVANPSLLFYVNTAFFFGLIVLAYIVAYLIMGESILAKRNLWIGTGVSFVPK